MYCVILPTYNEAQNIKEIIEKIFSILPDAHILVVDDNSPDDTARIVEDLQKQYPHLLLLWRERKEGLGAAYIHTFKTILENPISYILYPKFSHVIMMDADFSHNPKYLPDFIEASKQYDLVISSRYVRGGGSPQWEFWRKLLSKCGNMYVSLVLKNKIHPPKFFSEKLVRINDWTGGFNCINTDILRKVDLDTVSASGYAFQIELKYRLIKAGARVKEIPIIFEPRRGGESKLTNHIVWEGITTPWRLRLREEMSSN